MISPEEFRNCPSSRELAGGALVAPGLNDEGLVALTKYGEMGLDVFESGIMTTFPDSGLVFHYGNDYELNSVSVNVAQYLRSLDDGQKHNMPRGGEQMDSFLRWLNERKLTAYLTASFETGEVEVNIITGDDETIRVNKDEGISFRNGYLGILKFGEMKLIAEIRYLGDSIAIGLGETGMTTTDGTTRYGVIKVDVSPYVDFEKYVDGTSDYTLDQLAREILIG